IAVSMVMCNEPVMRTPLSGLLTPYFLRMDIKPGISCSETSMVLRPHSASERSRTEKSCLDEPLPLVFTTVRRAGESLIFAIKFVGFFPSDFGVVLAEVTVIGRLAVNRSEQIELLDNVRGIEAEHFAHSFLD